MTHDFPPLWNSGSRTLILGSFPSVKSREDSFYYAHPQNRFWKVLAEVYGEPVPQTKQEKTCFVLSHGLALWDVIESCDIKGSQDSSIMNAEVTDLPRILRKSRIDRIFVNGAAAYRLYEKYQEPVTGIRAVQLPSTSPANAAWTQKKLAAAWAAVRCEQ
ncbi:MAG: DNA-deoxyinosine glycosylase [Lachnospiraceae bacterium]|nr:DNA-deoxyinosine glycosylase [Lachnospiraceae bacterium]